MIQLKDNRSIKVNYNKYPCHNCRKRIKCVIACYAVNLWHELQQKRIK